MKTYLPSRYINNNYRYSINNYYYTVRTNESCYTQYNTTYCNCYDIYFNNDYLATDAYSCNYNSSTNINASNFTSQWVYRFDIVNVFIISGIIFAFIWLFVFKPISRLFGRWLKV